jgi:radical SAM superfamily enzyme YgiQ (UPF0313 family)
MTSSAAVVLCTLNAKYIHASLGLRYLLANMGALRGQTLLREFTIARKPQELADELLALEPKVIGFGVYIWNVTQTTEVVRLLKAARPGIKLVLGGPEVSHEVEQQAATPQSAVHTADHVITGWGDVSFPKLCQALLHGPQPLMKIMVGEQPPLDAIALPYSDYSADDLAHRVLYVEASRGCPFKCEFCLSSLDKTAWAFDLDRFLAELESLYQRGARTFKFVDRTFNLKIDASIRILQFFLDKLEDGGQAAATGRPEQGTAPSGGSAAHAVASVGALFVHFEVIPDHLPDRLKEAIALFPPGVLQFEIGIQSFNVEVQQRISRRQDNAKTEANLRWLVQASNAHLHTDLIFGLPGESLQSFAEGFDRLYALKPHEIQIGMLKRLRGTPIARHTVEHGMVYDPGPPYTVQQTNAVSREDMQRFARLARYWDLIANSGRFAQTLAWLLEPSSAPAESNSLQAEPISVRAEPVEALSPFHAFLRFSDWLWRTTSKTSNFPPEALVDALFDYLTTAQQLEPAAARQLLLADYLKSGARASPRSLKGLLPRPAGQAGRAALPNTRRQLRHEPSDLANSP